VSECDERNKQGERVSKQARSHRENHRKKRDKGKPEWDNEAKREDENDHDNNDDDDKDEMYVVSGGSHCMILSSLVRTWLYLLRVPCSICAAFQMDAYRYFTVDQLGMIKCRPVQARTYSTWLPYQIAHHAFTPTVQYYWDVPQRQKDLALSIVLIVFLFVVPTKNVFSGIVYLKVRISMS
jgi:hypothetical protein